MTESVPDEDPPVDIHKPKPWHGFREFLKEYLIIVVGVLTALGGEQLVERLHRSAEITEAREALHAELAANSRTARFTLIEVKCLAEQLDAYDAWAKGGPHPQVIRANFPAFASSSWEAVKSGAVPHMPLKERLALSRYYDGVDNIRWALENERNTYLRFAGAVRHERLSVEAAQRLIDDVGQARLIGRVRASNATAFIDMAQALGVRPTPFSAAGKANLTRICGRTIDG